MAGVQRSPESLAAQTQEMAVHSAGRGAQGSRAARARLEEEGAGGGWPRRALSTPPPSPAPPHFHFLPASPAGAAYLTHRLRPSELTFQARAGRCGGKAITPLYKNKNSTTSAACLFPGGPRGGAGTGSKLPRSCWGEDSRGLHHPLVAERSGQTAHSALASPPAPTPCAPFWICNREHTSRPHDREGQTQSFICK